MGRIGALFFTFLYLLAMVRPVTPLFTYLINQDYIAEFLCVNKDKPALNCNGKCYLMELLKEKNEEKKENMPRIAMEDYPIGIIEIYHIIGITFPEERNTICRAYANNYTFIYSYTDFHPPTLSI